MYYNILDQKRITILKSICEKILPSGFYLAGIEDIAAMKMSAIGGRGAKKDFFDLYHILTMTDMTSNGLLECIKQKYGENFDFTYMLMGMDYFDDAETEILPELFVEFDWNRTKDFFVRKKKELIDIAYYDISEKG